jgi:hypothetical protein
MCLLCFTYMGFDIPEDDILYSHRRENLKPYMKHEAWSNSPRVCCLCERQTK